MTTPREIGPQEHPREVGYPFTAVVGQDDLKTALLLNAVDPRVGGVLVQGERGTAKSTAARGLAALLPPIAVYAGNAFHCGPGDEAFAVCDATAPLVEARPPFIDLPIGTSEDRVTGTLDLERTLRSGERRFEPGLLAAAHRGVLYIDEVNLLPDHLVDLLLDVAASGVHAVEREGVSVRHPSRFLLVGTMNPEEGELRLQFLDRFGLCVTVAAPTDPAERAEVVRRRVAFDAAPEAFAVRWAVQEAALAQRLRAARDGITAVEMPEHLLALAVRICLEANVDGLRPDLTVYRAAVALAALDGRARVVEDDVYRAALLALEHRRRPHPLDTPPTQQRSLEEIVEQHRREDAAAPEEGDDAPQETPPDAPSNDTGGDNIEAAEGGPPAPDRVVAPAAPIDLRLPTAPPGVPRRARASTTAGRRGAAANAGTRGRIIGTRAFDGRSTDIAPLASVLAAAARSASAPLPPFEGEGRGGGLRFSSDDLRLRRRRTPARRFVLYLVDCSGSMGARDRMAATKAAMLPLLAEAYRGRNIVALMGFRDGGASMLVAPTRAIARAIARLRALPTGGRTPLAAALLAAAAAVRRERARLDAAEARVVIVTDGRGDDAGLDRGIAALLAQTDDIVVVDSEGGFVRLGRARRLAERLGARYASLAA